MRAKQNKKKAKRKIPPWGRKEKHVRADLSAQGLHQFSADVPLGNTDPTEVKGILYGGMPNSSRTARGPVRPQRGRYS